MSGPNTARWRDAIIRRLHEKPDGFWLNEVLGVTHTWSEYVALHTTAGVPQSRWSYQGNCETRTEDGR